VADETATVDGVSDGSDESRECMPCRGSGQVISNLGGSPKTVTCPWCSGTGIRQPNVDAQATWRERQAAEVPSGDPSAGEPPVGEPPAGDPPSGEPPAAA
jgi:hypothetical protein